MKKTIKVRLYFPPDGVEQPVTYRLSKDYDLVFSILQAEISSGRTGKLTLELTGEADNVATALDYLAGLNIRTRIFTKSILWNQDRCVHCGACTAVCPSQALHMDPESWELKFDQDKCLICEKCITACPFKAMDVDIFA